MAQDTSIAASKKIAVTFLLPNPSVFIPKILKKIQVLFSVIYNPLRRRVAQSSSYAGEAIKGSNFSEKFNSLKKLNKKKLLKMVFPAVLVIVAIIVVISIAKNLPDAQNNSTTNNFTQVDAPNAIATINLDKKFSFPLRDEKGKKVASFDYIIQSASINKQIIVQGKRATAVTGRVFLILNLKIVNNLKQSMELPARSFVRVIVNSNEKELLAPDIHNDPVEVQAISTKYTRLGLAINEADAYNVIKLQIGEIDGEKQTIELKFKK